MNNYDKLSVKDLAFLIVSAGFFGAIWIVYGIFYNVLEPILKPLNLTGLLQGVWYISGGFCGIIIRKRYSTLIGELLPTFIEISLSSWGFYNLIYGLAQGVVAEIIFNISGYRYSKIKTMMVANIFAALAGGICDYFFYDFSKLSLSYNIIKVLCQIISTILFTILVSLLIHKLLKLGYLKQYNIAKAKSWIK